MDAALLTGQAFWNDSTPAASEPPGHVLFKTSGSTGPPKWVAISKQALLISAEAVNQHLEVTDKSCWGLVLPPHHVGGFGVAARAYEAGCRLQIFDRRWDAFAFCDWLKLANVTHLSLVPTQVHDLVKANLTSPRLLEAIVVGGGHLDLTTGQAARDLGWPVLASYGMTEAASQIATQGLGQLQALYQPSPISILPIWNTRISSEGLLSISGPALFSGYVSDGNYVAQKGEWFTTTDRVLFENGAITPLGRADTLIKVLGELVDPQAIERELISLSDERLVSGTFAILAIADERAEHVLIPVFESFVDPAIIEIILARYQRDAPGFRRLKPAIIIEKLPRSELGKLRRDELAALLKG